jgi:hypothetical protein
MASTTSQLHDRETGGATRPSADAAALIGLVARGLLYLVLAGLAVELVVGSADTNVDARGALHELAREGAGKVALVVLVLGFAGFALWHLFVAVRPRSGRSDMPDRLADGMRAAVYGFLSVLSASFLAAPKPSGDTDEAGQAWTARLLDWSGGQLLVGAVGAAVIAAGLWLAWRALRGGPQDAHAVLDAAPEETGVVHWLGALGNVARGAVVTLVGLLLLVAAIDYDPDEAVGLDGALKRVLDESYGEVLVLLVAAGLAAYGIYSIARAWVNRRRAVAA